MEVSKHLFQGSKKSKSTQFPDLEDFSGFDLTIIPIWNSISSLILGVSVPDHSAIIVDHHGALLIQSGALMHLQYGMQLAYLTTIQLNQFDPEFFE
jgi:hypothetical protein